MDSLPRSGNETQERALVEAGVIIKGTIVKLGQDVHARQITVSRQTGDCTPQPSPVFTKERLLVWVRKMARVRPASGRADLRSRLGRVTDPALLAVLSAAGLAMTR